MDLLTVLGRFVQVLCKCVLRLLGECNDGVYLGDDVTVENEEVVAGLLEVMAVMLAVLFPRLNKASLILQVDSCFPGFMLIVVGFSFGCKRPPCSVIFEGFAFISQSFQGSAAVCFV